MGYPPVSHFLWFKDHAEEAVDLYCSLFSHARKGAIRKYGPGAAFPEGHVMTVDFTLNGVPYTAFNGGTYFQLTEAFSMMVHCKDQEEIDKYYDGLSEGGEEMACGWVRDRYGLSWQVVSIDFMERMQNGEPERCERMMQALLTMKRPDLAKLNEAYFQ